MSGARTKLYKPALLLAAIALLGGVFTMQRSLNHDRKVLELTRTDPLENAPPMLAFTTVALGGFRGLIANVLWIRASDLQEKDKYFEMVQLADWITTLQPHFTQVWVHQAWNMAYNISIKFDDPRDRWRWVRAGIELLRDRGLRQNPREPLMYRELAWFYQHKMGANLDDAHNFYKQYWAEEMEAVLGGGRPNFDELLDPQTEEARARVKMLREKYNMDPRWMKLTDERYGPLEWRLPETHAIYWAVVGMDVCKDREEKSVDVVQLRRVIFQSMQLAFHRGRLIFPRKGSKEFVYGPNLNIIPQANAAYEEMIRQEPEATASFATGQKNFLKTAVYFLYTHNRMTEAQRWFDYLKQHYPRTPEAPHEPAPDTTLDEFALAKIQEDIGETSHDRVKTILLGLLLNSYVNLAMGNDDEAEGYKRLAEKVWQRYQNEIVDTASETRVGLPRMPTLQAEALNELLNPETGLQKELAAQLRTALDLPADFMPGPSSSTSQTNQTSSATNAVPQGTPASKPSLR